MDFPSLAFKNQCVISATRAKERNGLSVEGDPEFLVRFLPIRWNYPDVFFKINCVHSVPLVSLDRATVGMVTPSARGKAPVGAFKSAISAWSRAT